ncbi:MAG: hypothetical protein EA376_05420 [Phycisphaeraceae bacterium]|nr:MAG: hypothetical protein EA376_05420 [Phycisphaeraceae bacterium]
MTSSILRILAAVFLLIALTASLAPGFTLLGFRTWEQIQNGSFHYWQIEPLGTPFTLSYAIDDDFLNNQGGPEFTGLAHAAVVSALDTWSETSGGFITFEEAPWSPVPNDNDDGIPPAWEGPSFEEWLDDQELPQEERQFGNTLPGWGANVDVFSRSSGFEIFSGNLHFVMSPTTLAFAIVNRTGGKRIRSVDIYLNEDFTWSTTGQSGTFDVETVVLHELGHALGLDHPKDAVAEGSVNLDPNTFEPGWPWSSADVMHPVYTGIKRQLTIDEVGALQFLYGVEVEEDTLPGDINGDGVVNSQDLALVLGSWGACPKAPLPCISDINGDGLVNAQDLAILLANWGASLADAD